MNGGLNEKRFYLFNTRRFAGAEFKTKGLGVVPVLYEGPFSHEAVMNAEKDLRTKGSKAAPGFMNIEGLMIFFQHSGNMLKYPFGK